MSNTLPPNPLREIGVRVPARNRTYLADPWKIITNGGSVHLVDQHEGSVVRVKDSASRPIVPLPSYDVHGGGHSWGYGGSGPAQLALDLLLDVLGEWPSRKAMDRGDCLAQIMHQDFKEDVIARFPGDRSWVLPGALIVAWVMDWVHTHWRRYNDWVIDQESAIVLRRFNRFEQMAEDGISAQGADAIELAELRTYDSQLAAMRHFPQLLDQFARDHNYPPFNDSTYILDRSVW